MHDRKGSREKVTKQIAWFCFHFSALWLLQTTRFHHVISFAEDVQSVFSLFYWLAQKWMDVYMRHSIILLQLDFLHKSKRTNEPSRALKCNHTHHDAQMLMHKSTKAYTCKSSLTISHIFFVCFLFLVLFTFDYYKLQYIIYTLLQYAVTLLVLIMCVRSYLYALVQNITNGKFSHCSCSIFSWMAFFSPFIRFVLKLNGDKWSYGSCKLELTCFRRDVPRNAQYECNGLTSDANAVVRTNKLKTLSARPSNWFMKIYCIIVSIHVIHVVCFPCESVFCLSRLLLLYYWFICTYIWYSRMSVHLQTFHSRSIQIPV